MWVVYFLYVGYMARQNCVPWLVNPERSFLSLLEIKEIGSHRLRKSMYQGVLWLKKFSPGIFCYGSFEKIGANLHFQRLLRENRISAFHCRPPSQNIRQIEIISNKFTCFPKGSFTLRKGKYLANCRKSGRKIHSTKQSVAGRPLCHSRHCGNNGLD